MSKSTNRLIMLILALIIAAAVAFVIYQQLSNRGGGASSTNSIDYSIQPSLGSDDAPVKVTMFEDFSCPHCATFTEEVLPRLKDDFLESGQAEFFFVNNQFLGPDSTVAGVASECAYQQDEKLFWDYKTVLMRAQRQVNYNAKGLSELAANVPGLDVAALSTCIEENRHVEAVTADLEMGRALGVTSTPTVFVNGEMVKNGSRSDPSYDGISKAINAALAANTSNN